jgi:hypothetical protein
VVEVRQEVAGRVAVHNVVDPELNVTVPVPADGIPDVDSVTALPNVVDVGFAVAAMVYPDSAVIVNVVEAVAPV